MEREEYQQIINKFKEDNKELIKSGKCKKVFTDFLIKDNKKGTKIRWSANFGKLVYFIYNNIEGYIKIIECGKNKCLIKYKDGIFEISKDSLLGCKLGELLKKNTSDFKIEIGTKFKDNKRDIIITDREYRKDKNGNNYKWYKYICYKCGWTEGWMPESSVLKEIGCSCCNGKTVVEDINSIVTTDKWLIPYFQGGYDEAKLYTRKSGKKILPICPDCGRVKSKLMTIDGICRRKTISCNCSDKTPYTEKVVFSVLEQLGLKFEYHKVFEWSKNIQVDNVQLCGRKEYDFYFKINEELILLEAHGIQHYEESNRGRNLFIEQENDKLKEELSLTNGIKKEKYIIVDCRYSTLEWIKEHVMNNEKLNRLFDLSIIDWLKAEEYACSNLVKIASEYKRNNPELTTGDIGEIMGYEGQTILKWIKKGYELGWCNYDAKIESSKIISKFIINKSNPIACVEKEMYFKSVRQCALNSLELFGITLTEASIGRACKSGKKHKGFTFKYTSDLTPTELLQYKQQIEQATLNQAI